MIEKSNATVMQCQRKIKKLRVLGPPQDIREVQNAFEAYEMLTKFDLYSVNDLLKAHRIMMSDLMKESGIFQSKGVGVSAGSDLIHAGTPPQYVPELIAELFAWLKIKNGKSSAKRLAAEIGITQRQVERIINNLKISGIIQRIGAN